jgi:uncharacterized repeat protein (TIGR02543 family)
MEKFNLRLLFAVILYAFSCAAGFSQEGNGGASGSNNEAQPASFTVIFDAAGGVIKAHSSDKGESSVKRTVDSGKEIEKENWPLNPTKDGQQFGGWFTKKPEEGGEEFTQDTPVTDNITVHAKWRNPQIYELKNLLESTSNELKSVFGKIESLQNKIDKNLFLLLIAAGIVVLLLAALVTLNLILLIFIKKMHRCGKKVFEKAEVKYNNIEQKFSEYDDNFVNIDHQLQRLSPERSSLFLRPDETARLKNDITDVKTRIQNLEQDMRVVNEQKIITRKITSGILGVVESFNLWAENPSVPLPLESFYYIEGEINIRTVTIIKESPVETKWITNRNGVKKYLFPNPNSFNQMTNILKFYTMDQAKLKGKGQNKIKIIRPCEMKENGFIEFPGALELL